jgi:putative membrane protein
MVTHLKRVAIVAAVLVLPAGIALAQGGPPWEWSGWFFLFPGFRFLFVLACLAAFVYFIVRMARRPAEPRSSAGLDILNERFARGEIDKAEYEDKRRLIADA